MSKSLPRTPQTITMPPTKPPRNQAPLTADNAALYRCILSCGVVKSACEGKGIPKDCRREDWIDYNLACAIEGLAQHLMERA